MMDQAAAVSVIIPYYQQQRYIRETVISALNQDGARMEVIVVDDGSPKPAAPFLSDLEGVRVIRTENHGCAAARNCGLKQSKGAYLIFLDGDDLLQPNAVQAHLNAFTAEPEAGLSFGAYRVIDEHGLQLQPPQVCRRRGGFHRVLFGTSLVPSPGATMIRREALVEVRGFDESLSGQVDDYDLYLRLVRRHPFARHISCVLAYRLHDRNVSRDRNEMQRGVLEVLDRIAVSEKLTAMERRRLRYGRATWVHYYNPEPTVAYRIKGSFYRLRTRLTVPPKAWFGG